MVRRSDVRIWAIAGLLIALSACSEPNRVLVPDIPMPPGVTVRAVDKPGEWTSLTADQALAIARAGGGPKIGANPVIRFLWLQGSGPLKRFDDGPAWVIVWQGEPDDNPAGGDPPVPRRILTWTVVSTAGERMGSTANSALETLPPN
jgi:hypothetical protein